ncbi:hypothetical protein HY450_00625 [Candidatus Pacearchaeota archaeon]|nr:hypothetical protein [Candidatus Pacearchaeota archaeon]
MNILFVCKHNRFRSKIAEGIFNKINKNKKHRAKSAGIIRGSYPLDKTEVAVAKKLGIKLSGKPRGLNKDLLRWHNIAIIAANDVPKSIFKDNERFGKKLIVWKIPDWKGDDKKEIIKIIKKIELKVKRFAKEVAK